MNNLTHFSLFTGIGGIDLAAEWAGFESVGQCEFADYPTKVLEKHWPDVPRWRDIRDVTLESVRSKGIRTIDLISGGFPCQPFSVAGKQLGNKDERYLWPEMLRVIHELQPSWVLGENVIGIVNMALEQVCTDLENEGYEVQPFIIPAAAVEAHHQRKRVFIVAHSRQQPKGSKVDGSNYKQHNSCAENIGAAQGNGSTNSGENVANSKGDNTGRLPIRESEAFSGSSFSSEDVRNTTSERFQDRPNIEMGRSKPVKKPQRSNWWAVEPDVGRVAHGIPSRVDRLKCLGNAVVPQQVYPILQAIAKLEEEEMTY